MAIERYKAMHSGAAPLSFPPEEPPQPELYLENRTAAATSQAARYEE
jgi:hypothetical protein